MGYEIKYEDIRNVRTTAISQITLWQQQLEEILESFQNLGNNMGMEGETAASIGYYVQDVHYTIIGNILQVLAEYLTRLAVYEEGFRSIDDAGDAHITQDVLEEKGTQLQSKREEFRELNESIQNVLNQIADICCILRPANGSIELGFYEVIEKLEQLNDRVGSYENSHLADCQPVRDYLQSVQSFISGQSGKGKVIISTYTAGSVFQNPAYQTLKQYYDTSSAYTGVNKEAVEAVYQRTQAEVEAAIRKGEGQAKIIDGIVMIGGVVIGVAAIVASGGMATPAVAAVTAGGGATVTLYGASNLYEGIDMYRLGLAGDVTSAAFNPIRDTIFQGNQTVYDIWGTIGSAMFASGSMMNSYMGAGKAKITEVKGLAERAKWGGGSVDDWFMHMSSEDVAKYKQRLDLLEGKIPDTIDGIKVTDGKVGGKIPISEYLSIRDASVHNVYSDSMTLGKYLDDNISYIESAKDRGSMFFDLGDDWGIIQKRYGIDADDVFELLNKPALDDAIRNGKTIRFSHDPRLPKYNGSALYDEWKYLQEFHGYQKIEQSGGGWIAVR